MKNKKIKYYFNGVTKPIKNHCIGYNSLVFLCVYLSV